MFYTALIMGFAGSLHCVGMCSPLAMAATNMTKHAWISRLVYNAGRILTYGILGAVIAVAGFATPLSEFQNLLSIGLGVCLLLVGAGLMTANIPFVTKVINGATSILKKLFAKFLQRKSYASTFILGTLNGLLPCGLVLLALTFCLTLASPVDGFIFMLTFGLGTLPVMLGLTGFLQYCVGRFKLNFRKVTTGMILLSGIVLIARVFIFEIPHHAGSEHGLVDIIICR